MKIKIWPIHNPVHSSLRSWVSVLYNMLVFMSREEAIQLAQLYLLEEDRDHPLALDSIRILNSPTEYEGCWYFDYRYYYPERLSDQSRDMIGGAPGFVVPKQGKHIRVITWHELYELNQMPLQF